MQPQILAKIKWFMSRFAKEKSGRDTWTQKHKRYSTCKSQHFFTVKLKISLAHWKIIKYIQTKKAVKIHWNTHVDITKSLVIQAGYNEKDYPGQAPNYHVPSKCLACYYTHNKRKLLNENKTLKNFKQFTLKQCKPNKN